MKLFNKILCAVSALSMIASLTAFSVSANSRAFNIAVTDESGKDISSISANDKLKITITVDDEVDLEGLQYKVNIDTTKLNIDTTSSGRPAVLGFVDKTWWVNADYSNNMRYCFTNGDLKFLTDSNQISIAYAGEKITSDYAVKNGVIGIYYVTAKSDITAADPLVVSLSDAAVSLGGQLVKVASNTVTIPAAPSIKKATAEVVESKNNIDDKAEGEPYTQGFKFEVIGNNETVIAVPFTLTADGTSKTFEGFTGLNITGATPVYYGVNVKEIPYNKTVEADPDVVVKAAE